MNLPDLNKKKDKRMVLAKMGITFIASEVYGIKGSEIQKELGISKSLVRYYVRTYPHELRINKDQRAITERVKAHEILNKKYFSDVCMEKLNKEPIWNVWISDMRYLCQIGNVLIDPDLNKQKINTAYKEGFSLFCADLIELNDKEIIWQIIEKFGK